MKKLSILFWVMAAWVINAQELHLVLLKPDLSMDNDAIVDAIENMHQKFGEDLVLYNSIDALTIDETSWIDSKWQSSVYTRSAIQSTQATTELDILSRILEKCLKPTIIENKIVSNKYKSVVFDCFVGDSFFDNDNQNLIIARLLYYNSMNHGEIKVVINYYPCGALYTESSVQFSGLYSINSKPKIIK